MQERLGLLGEAFFMLVEVNFSISGNNYGVKTPDAQTGMLANCPEDGLVAKINSY